MEKIFITENSKQTQELGEMLAKELKGGEIICLSGDLGSGKTTFTQGLLKGLGAKGPYTSPTFTIMKYYQISATRNPQPVPAKRKKRFQVSGFRLQDVYHIDAYRVGVKDMLNLGWKEIVAGKNNVIIVEWAERIKKIIPKDSLWIKMEWLDENKRSIIIK